MIETFSRKKILMSAYSCNPFGVSESLAAFRFLRILLKDFNIILLTTIENKDNILKFYGNECDSNLQIISFKDKYPGRQNKLIQESLKLGYFIFNFKMYRFLKKNDQIVSNCDLLYHKSPSGFRYFSYLYKFKKPFVFGPTGGGLKPPKVLHEFFKKEHKIFKLRNLDSKLLKTSIYKKHYKKADTILITLPYVKEILGKQYDSKYYELFDTGIDTKKHRPLKIDSTSNKVKIIYVGKLTRYKGGELLIKAVHKINTNIPFSVEIYGNGEEKEFLINLSNSLSLRDKINFHGHIAHKEMPLIYSQASIFCFPTITEASGNALLEAMSYRLPIITVNNGGPKYMCPDKGAIKVEIDDPKIMIDNIAGGLQMLLENRQQRIAMGQSNREHCVNNFDWKIIEKKILDFFHNKLVNL